MARAGEMIEHPISGERMVFILTGADTGGELLQIDLFVAPGGAVGVEHVHPRQEERFIVQRGVMTLAVGEETSVLRAGDEAIVPAGVAHEWWNSGDEELNAVLEFRPAGRFADFISTYFGLAAAGQVDDAGMPGRLQSAVTLHEYRDTVVLTAIPTVVRMLGLPFLAAVGRLLGLRPDYPYPPRQGAGRESVPEAVSIAG
jgi:quercetin dioxygenase-like cupin family protein